MVDLGSGEMAPQSGAVCALAEDLGFYFNIPEDNEQVQAVLTLS